MDVSNSYQTWFTLFNTLCLKCLLVNKLYFTSVFLNENTFTKGQHQPQQTNFGCKYHKTALNYDFVWILNHSIFLLHILKSLAKSNLLHQAAGGHKIIFLLKRSILRTNWSAGRYWNCMGTSAWKERVNG